MNTESITYNKNKFRIVKHEHLLDNGRVYKDYRPQKKGWRYGLLVGAIITNIAWVIAYITV